MLFYVDKMLGKLCKFLRIKGEMCIYLGEEKASLTNNPSLRGSISMNKEKIFVTRNKKNIDKSIDRIRRKYGDNIDKVIVIPYTSLSHQLLKLYHLNIIGNATHSKIPRCTLCGGELEIIPSSSLPPHTIPPKVLKYHTTFYYCSYCNKYYWKGKHWENISKILNNL